MDDPLRTMRYVVALLVGPAALFGLPLLHVLLSMRWAAPGALMEYDLRPFPPESLYGQLATYWCLIGGWVLTALSGWSLLWNWPGRLRGRWRQIAVLAPLLWGLAVLTATVLLLPLSSNVRCASLDGLGRLMHMQFPPGSELLGARVVHGMDWVVAAKLRLPSDQTMPFVRGSFTQSVARPYQKPPRLNVTRGSIPETFRWARVLAADAVGVPGWAPEKLRDPLAATASTTMITADLVFSLDESPSCVAYLVYSVM